MLRLGINVDHVATLREARRIRFPDPVAAAAVAEMAGADNITVHLREDRRHIQDRDVQVLRRTIQTRLNLEMAATQDMVKIATEVRPDSVTLVPERREEVTTEGGLDLRSAFEPVARAVRILQEAEIPVALFIDPDPAQIELAARTAARAIEIHTGRYCDAAADPDVARELEAVARAARAGAERGLEVHAGHGLHTRNVTPIARIAPIVELNIGHSIVSRAIFVGLEAAVREMKAILLAARDPRS